MVAPAEGAEPARMLVLLVLVVLPLLAAAAWVIAKLAGFGLGAG